MADQSNTRREFIKVTSAALASTAIGSVATGQQQNVDAPNILNQNPKMGYRRLGKTDFRISEVGLGGHGGKSVDDRVPVLERAVESGINYVDNNIDAECNLYGEAMEELRSMGFALKHQ